MNGHGAQPAIGDYGLISDLHSSALVSSAGSVDWCCFPRFDSAAVFSRILDWQRGGYFQLAPQGVHTTERRYLPNTKIIETTFHADGGSARLTDLMPVRSDNPDDPRAVEASQQIVRTLECTSGEVRFSMRCRPRFDYGTIIPHVTPNGEHRGVAHGGADALAVYCSAPMRDVSDDGFLADGRLRSGERVSAAVTYGSHTSAVADGDVDRLIAETRAFWEGWAAGCRYDGAYRDEVMRSALTLKALTYAPSGGLVAAATTSLPEAVGGPRNWDYRFTWIRDASFALYALSILGYREEARHFKSWLEWSTSGRARDLQIMYGLGGERRLTEIELPELDGYRGSRPVRIGNGAYSQFQLDIYGEVMDSAHLYRIFGGEMDPEYWNFLRHVAAFVIDHWREPDDGLWESRGGRQHFVFSKVMCWVALDRAIKAARALDMPGDVDLWARVRAEIRDEVLTRGYDADRGAFVQAYGSKNLDASNLLLPLFGFIRATDPRMESTIRATSRELTSPEGLVYRYRGYEDGLAGGEGTFTVCTFWLADNLILLGEVDRAREVFQTLLSHGNDLGLFSEEIEPGSGEMLGNFPQAFSHMGLINTARNLDRAGSRSRPD